MVMESIKIGLALGSGAARGWAHIGVIQALAENGIHPDIVCGTSAGALVGGAYVAGHMGDLELWLRTLNRAAVARFFDLSLTSGGLIAGKRIINFFNKRFGDFEIESLPIRFAAVATELTTGHEIWFRTGSMLDAVRASISVPGIFEPFHLNGRWYVDGGIVNPVPVSVCRALGADIVIAVNLNKIYVGQPLNHFHRKLPGQPSPDKAGTKDTHNLPVRLAQNLKDRVSEALSQIWRGGQSKPGLFYVLNNSACFMQERITRGRLACDPPDITLSPHIEDIGFMDFHRAAKAIELGKRCVQHEEREIKRLISN